MAGRDLYEILGVSRDASKDEIKKAYRKLARELHPDRNPGDRKAEERFKELSHAYEVLASAKKRKLYDEFGETGLREGFNPDAARQYSAWQQGGGGGTFNVEDIFGGQVGGSGFRFNVDLEDLLGGRGVEELFGRARGRRSRPGPERPPGGTDLESEVTIDFVDALRGTERDLTFSTPNGRRNLRVRIPAGVTNGGRIRLRGQGVQSERGGRAGDLLLRVHVREHPWYWREGDDLHVKLPITPGEAYKGAKVEVPTLTGPVSLRIPAGTQSGAKLRLRGKGVPGKSGGDLIVHVEIRLPEARDAKTEQLVDELDKQFGRDVRADLRL